MFPHDPPTHLCDSEGQVKRGKGATGERDGGKKGNEREKEVVGRSGEVGRVRKGERERTKK